MKFLDLSVLLCLLAGNILCDAEEGSSRTKRQSPPYSYPQPYPNSYGDPMDQPPQCRSPPACKSPNALPNQDGSQSQSWLIEPRLFYMPLSTCYGYTLNANILLGRPVYSLRELQEGCYTQFFAKTGFDFATGYGAQYVLDCSDVQSTGTPTTICTMVGGDNGTDTTLERSETDYVLASDGMSWILYYRCLDNHYGDVQLFTTRPYFSRKTLRKVLPIIYTLGFYPEDIMALQCYYSTYVVPFQNYPVPDTQISAFGTCPSNPFQYVPNYNNNPSDESDPPNNYQPPPYNPPNSPYRPNYH